MKMGLACFSRFYIATKCSYVRSGDGSFLEVEHEKGVNKNVISKDSYSSIGRPMFHYGIEYHWGVRVMVQ